jgi:cysteine desulfurase/selenocysteine lyase
MNLVASSFCDGFLKEGDEVVISTMEHHSNIVPWQLQALKKGIVLRVIPMSDEGVLDMSAFESLLSEKTKLVSVAHVSNVLGTVNPVKEIIRKAHERDIPVLIDGAQSAPHIAIDVQDMDCDFFAFSGHKMYGPTGIGVLYGKEEWLEKMPPYQGGGEMIEHVRWSGTTYNTLPYRFEAGTPDYVGAYAWGVAVQYILDCGWQRILTHEQDLAGYAEESLARIPGVHIYAGRQPKAGVLSLNVYTPQGTLIHPFDLGTLLDHQGVAVRTGHHCAEPLINHLGVPGTLRLSFGLYNTREDIDLFIAALQRAMQMLA